MGMNMIFKNKDVKVILLEVFLIALGLVGLTLGVKYIMNSINVNVDTSKLAIDSMNANVTNGTLTPIIDSTVNINTTSNVLRITFDVKGASTNTGSNIIYDVLLNLTADCSLKNESVKWNLYKNNNLLISGTTSPKYDKNILKGKIMLTDIQQDLVPYSKTADKYVFILWMSESCNEEDITKCDISKGLTSDSGGKSISGNIDIRLNSGKKKENKRESIEGDACEVIKGTYIVEHLDDGTAGDSGSGVYKVTHSAIPAESSATGSEIPAVTDYRYYGPSPNNYICLDMEGQSTCADKHLYRIIGSIYEENESTNRLKVIKATPLTDGTTSVFSWDNKNIAGAKAGKNIWATITSGNYSNSLTNGSTLMQLLNSGLWWNGESGEYYNDDNPNATAVTVNFTNYKLSDKVKNYITPCRYYLGGNNSRMSLTNDMYGYERGTLRYDTDSSLYWDGMVGLMYPSDYGYAAGNTCVTETTPYNYDGECKNKDWLWMTTSSNYFGEKEWLISPLDTVVFTVRSSGSVNTWNVKGGASVRPTFYLTSSTYITDGEGSISNPYQIDVAINPYIEVKPEYKDGISVRYGTRDNTEIKSLFNYYPSNSNVRCDYNTINDVAFDLGRHTVNCTLSYNYNGNIIEKFSNIEINVLPKKPTLD